MQVDDIYWTCEELGVTAKFTFNELGWSVSFPNQSIKVIRKFREQGIKLPWPEVPEEYKQLVKENMEQMLLVTRSINPGDD